MSKKRMSKKKRAAEVASNRFHRLLKKLDAETREQAARDAERAARHEALRAENEVTLRAELAQRGAPPPSGAWDAVIDKLNAESQREQTAIEESRIKADLPRRLDSLGEIYRQHSYMPAARRALQLCHQYDAPAPRWLIGALLAFVEEYFPAQGDKARAGAAARWKERAELAVMNEELASRHHDFGEPFTPSELWPLLYDMLDAAGYTVREITKPKSYIANGKTTITFDAFRKAIQRAR